VFESFKELNYSALTLFLVPDVLDHDLLELLAVFIDNEEFRTEIIENSSE
jgi:hypothetical protein